MSRTKGAKNIGYKYTLSKKVYPVRLEHDLQEFVDSQPNKNKFFNMIVRYAKEKIYEYKDSVEPNNIESL